MPWNPKIQYLPHEAIFHLKQLFCSDSQPLNLVPSTTRGGEKPDGHGKNARAKQRTKFTIEKGPFALNFWARTEREDQIILETPSIGRRFLSAPRFQATLPTVAICHSR